MRVIRVHTCSGGQMPERPETDSPGYKRVVARGCLGTTDYWGEADCIYGWTCEECPVLREQWRQEDQQNEEVGDLPC